jgi:hypothetical protein
MTDKPRKLPRLGFAGFEDSSAAAGTGRRKPRWAINPLRDGARASAEGARLASLADGIARGIGRKPEGTE